MMRIFVSGAKGCLSPVIVPELINGNHKLLGPVRHS